MISPLEEAAILEPVTTAARAIRVNEIKPGSFIVVLGPGPFGLFLLQTALATGPKELGHGWAKQQMRSG